MEPGYRQVRGCALNLGATVHAFPLDPNREWRPDLQALATVVSTKTRLIASESLVTAIYCAATEAIEQGSDRQRQLNPYKLGSVDMPADILLCLHISQSVFCR